MLSVSTCEGHVVFPDIPVVFPIRTDKKQLGQKETRELQTCPRDITAALNWVSLIPDRGKLSFTLYFLIYLRIYFGQHSAIVPSQMIYGLVFLITVHDVKIGNVIWRNSMAEIVTLFAANE